MEYTSGIITSIMLCRSWKGHNWAQPSEQHLRYLLREAYTHQRITAERGIAARHFVHEHFSLQVSMFINSI